MKDISYLHWHEPLLKLAAMAAAYYVVGRFGFLFYDHAALTATGLGPAVIKSRVASLGGLLNIDSSESGARLDVTLPLSSPRA